MTRNLITKTYRFEPPLEKVFVKLDMGIFITYIFPYRQQRKRQRIIRYHILRRKYVVHPNDIEVDPYVKNHMQFLHKNYPSTSSYHIISTHLFDKNKIFHLFLERWTAAMLSESFDQSVDNVRLILKQRTTRGMRVKPRPPSSIFGIKDEKERERLIGEHIIKRDLHNKTKPELEKNDGDPVDYQILAEESKLVPRKRPSDAYMKKDVRRKIYQNSVHQSDSGQFRKNGLLVLTRFLLNSTSH